VRLRLAVVGLGVLALLLGLLLIASGQLVGGGVQLTLLGVVVTAGALFEARRYRGASGPGHWQKTSERFIDPTSGRLTEVEYDPATGERRYVDGGEPPEPPR
jgi:hypothetical protein